MQRVTTTHAFRSLQAYWRHRACRRLREQTRNDTKPLKLGGGGGGGVDGAGTTQNRSGRVRAKGVVIRRRMFRLRALCSAPVRALTWMRDVYMDAMLALAGGDGGARAAALRSGSEQGRLWARRVPRARQMSASAGEFERRMMLHIYSAIVHEETHGPVTVSCKDQ